jgi:hypothetical protein
MSSQCQDARSCGIPRFENRETWGTRRIHEVWDALLLTFTVKELQETRYAQLMKEAGI